MDNIFTPNKKEQIVNEVINKDNGDVTYAMIGTGDKTDGGLDIVFDYQDPNNGRKYVSYERATAAARYLKVGSLEKYFIKTRDDGVIFDPRSSEHMSQAKMARNGLSRFRMLPVDGKRFKDYIEFLKTKNARYYTQARKAF